MINARVSHNSHVFGWHSLMNSVISTLNGLITVISCDYKWGLTPTPSVDDKYACIVVIRHDRNEN